MPNVSEKVFAFNSLHYNKLLSNLWQRIHFWSNVGDVSLKCNNFSRSNVDKMDQSKYGINLDIELLVNFDENIFFEVNFLPLV